MPLPVAQRQVNRDEAQCRHSAKRIFAFQQVDFFTVPRGSYGGRDTGYAAPGDEHLARLCEDCFSFSFNYKLFHLRHP
jgi:hypothetical protein